MQITSEITLDDVYDNFRQMGLDTTKESQIVKGCVIVGLINENGNVIDDNLQKRLDELGIKTSCAKLKIMGMDSLLNFAKKYTLSELVNVALPFVVADKMAFEIIPSRNEIEKIIVLNFLLDCKEKNSVDDDLMLKGSQSAFEICSRYINKASTVINIDSDILRDYWNAVFYYRPKQIDHKVRKNIRQAIDGYRALYFPMKALLTDYNYVISYNNILSKVFDPWYHLHKNIKKEPVEKGLSAMETAFEMYAFKIKDELPSDVINALFYSKMRDDSGSECSLVLKQFTAVITKTRANVCTSQTFYGWIFQFAGKMKIISPDKAVEEYKDMLEKAMVHMSI